MIDSYFIEKLNSNVIPPELFNEYVILKATRKDSSELLDDEIKIVYCFCHCVSGLITSFIRKFPSTSGRDLFNTFVVEKVRVEIGNTSKS
jgi:hypothetical protein